MQTILRTYSLEPARDEIQAILQRSGAQTAALDRLGRIAANMCKVELRLARRAALKVPTGLQGGRN